MAAKNVEPIIIGSDHAGFRLKSEIMEALKKHGIPTKDVGAHSDDIPSDYPVYAAHVAGAISAGTFKRGILICGEGLGNSIVANRYPRVHATLCLNDSMAKVAREKNDSNVLVLAQRYTPKDHALEILDAWLNTKFEGGRHKIRMDLINDSSHLNLAFRHLVEVDPEKVKNDFVNKGFMKRAIRGLEKLTESILPAERRDGDEERLAESFPTSFSYDGEKYNATLIDLCEGGAQLKMTQAERFPRFVRGEGIVLNIKTSYGLSTSEAQIQWLDPASSLFGVSFTKLPKNKKDPIRLALDSMF